MLSLLAPYPQDSDESRPFQGFHGRQNTDFSHKLLLVTPVYLYLHFPAFRSKKMANPCQVPLYTSENR
ncbi:MAG: hypothetical protein DSY91_07305 [Deltaproteobacteria bacterium]|nr:MAG: hypothetical protein DSY91_07305 [Deltaproteobacteria bacterium]